jgi:periplasmic divalent cation tolerance protein
MSKQEKIKIWSVYSTFSTEEEAFSVSRQLLEEGLIACANLIPQAVSVYRWQGKVQKQPETLLLAKTTQARLEAVIARVKDLHSYELPCIMACPLDEGFHPFMQWVAEETA